MAKKTPEPAKAADAAAKAAARKRDPSGVYRSQEWANRDAAEAAARNTPAPDA